MIWGSRIDRPNLDFVRFNYDRAITETLRATPQTGQVSLWLPIQATRYAIELALFEMAFAQGDWACAEALYAWATGHLASVAQMNPLANALLQQAVQRQAVMQRRETHGRSGCEASLSEVPRRTAARP